MGAGSDFRVKEFRFPQFSLNVVTNFEAHGKLRADNVWEVHAKGPVYDGKDLFQSFFDVTFAPDKGAKQRPGVDLRAEIDTVVGFYEIVSARRSALHAEARRQNDPARRARRPVAQ